MKSLNILAIFCFMGLNAICQLTDEMILQLSPQDMLEVGINAGKLQIVKTAIAKGADINKAESLPLCLAIRAANRGAGLSPGEEEEAYAALFGGTPPPHNTYVELTRWLLQNGANPNIDPDLLRENPPLLVAAEERDLETSRLLLSFKADPNIKNQSGNTALHILSIPIAMALPYEAGPEIAKLLIANGAKNIKDNNGYTPLARAKEDLEIIENTPFWKESPFYNNLTTSFKRLIEIYQNM